MMPTQIQEDHLSPLAEQGRTIYQEKLKAALEPLHDGEAVAMLTQAITLSVTAIAPQHIY